MPSRSSDREIRSLPERVIVGRVRRAHGLAGEVAVEIDSDVEGRFAVGAELWLVADGSAGRRSRIVSSRAFKGGCLIRLDGIGDRTAAQALRGARFEVDRSEVPPAEDGSWYYFELVGCECFEENRGSLGRVVDLIEDGGGLLLALESATGSRILIPFVRSFLRSVDVESGRIELRLPPGLIETCTSQR